MRKILIAAVAAIGVAALALGVSRALPFLRYTLATYFHVRDASARLPAAELEWRREFGDPVKRLAAHPNCKDSSDAVRLIDLARSAGVDMARPPAGEAPLREPLQDRAAHQAITDYVNAELTRTGGAIDVAPEEVQIQLATRGQALDRVVETLGAYPPPVWESGVSLGAEAPVPNLLGQIRMQRLLAARALGQSRAGNDAEVERTLGASWALNASLRDRPEVISQLIAMSVARMQAGLARRCKIRPEVWRKRLADHDYRKSLVEALEIESISRWQRFPLRGSSPMERASRTDYLDTERACLTDLRDSPVSDEPVVFHVGPYGDVEEPKTPGAVLASIEWPNLANAVRRADRLAIDFELTDRILRSREARVRLGSWPKTIPDFEASRLKDARWIYSVSSAGELTISLSRELHWEGLSGLVLPLRYQSE